MDKLIGVFLNECDIRNLVENMLDWVEVSPKQVFCAKNLMSENTPTGTSIIVGVDGIRCDAGSDTIQLVLSSGIYHLPVKTESINDTIDIRFDQTRPICGTFGVMNGDLLDILTEEEKQFSMAVDEQLGEREDELASLFREANKREIGERGLTLLEKMKHEIKNDYVLTENNVTPSELVASLIEATEVYENACASITELSAKIEDIEIQLSESDDEESKYTKKLKRALEVLTNKKNFNIEVSDFYFNLINATVFPILNRVVNNY